jgi:hypothetical protein
MKNTARVLELIDKGTPVRLALDMEGFGDVPEETTQRLLQRSREAQSKLLQGLYAAANDRRQTAASRAKAIEAYNKMKAEHEKSAQSITIIIDGEKNE